MDRTMRHSRHTAEQVIRKLKSAEKLIDQGKIVAEAPAAASGDFNPADPLGRRMALPLAEANKLAGEPEAALPHPAGKQQGSAGSVDVLELKAQVD